jgi:hypothetical protein
VGIESERHERRLAEGAGAGDGLFGTEPSDPTLGEPTRQRARGRDPAEGIATVVGLRGRTLSLQSAENGVHEGGGSSSRLGPPGEGDGLGHGGVRGNAKVEELVCAEAERVPYPGSRASQGTGDEPSQYVVEPPPPAEGAQDQLVQEGSLPGFESLDLVPGEDLGQRPLLPADAGQDGHGEPARRRRHAVLR